MPSSTWGGRSHSVQGEVESCLELPVKPLNHPIGYGEVRYTLGSMNSEQTCKLSPKRPRS